MVTIKNIDTKATTNVSSRKPEPADFDNIVSDLQLGQIGPCFNSGSLRFGCATATSDIDIIMLVDAKPAVLGMIKNRMLDLTESDYNSGIKTRYDDVVVNFSFLHPVDFVTWHKTADIISRYGLVKPSMSKGLRLGIHEALAAIIKIVLSFEPMTLTLAKQYFCSIQPQT